jgi:hypothetical protein
MLNSRYELGEHELVNGKKAHISVIFSTTLFKKQKALRTSTVTYCTIIIEEDNGSCKYYHGAAVLNPRDIYCPVKGGFWAFRRALMARFNDTPTREFACRDETFKAYRKKWGAILWKKITEVNAQL